MIVDTTDSSAPSDRLLKVLADYEQVLVVMHDNPDPDAIASGWAVVSLIHQKLAKPTNLIAGGAILRAENRHMVDLLGPPVQLVLGIDAPEHAATVLVDCGLGAQNQLLTRNRVEPVAVIDHHLADARPGHVPFVDIRPDVAASATIAASYLIEQHLEPGAKLATALWYAMRTETTGCEFRYSLLDQNVLVWLTERADPELLAEIENAPLPREYYGDLVAALRDAAVHRDSAFCMLPRATGAEIVGEIADLLIRCKGLDSVFCAAIVEGDLLISVRTDTHGANAVTLLQKTLGELGSCGGHAHRAGGKIPQVGHDLKEAGEVCTQLKTRWLETCGIEPQQRGEPLLTDKRAPVGKSDE